MATLISNTTGNFNAASFGTVDSTSLSDSEAANTALTTSYVTSSTFTPGAITLDGLAVKIASIAASPTGTITVALDQAGSDVIGTPVTLNVTDLGVASASSSNNETGWIFFKFASPILLLAATAYSVKAKTSSSSQVNLYSAATTNWSRLLRTTTTATPAAGDVIHIIGEHTGAGTGNSLVVTMDLTTNTDFGAGTDGVVAMTIGKRGTLIYGASTATNYYLKLSGDLIVYNGGELDIGTVVTPIPRDSTAVLEFDPVADGGMGLICRNGSTFIAQGLSRTIGKDIYNCKLTANAAVSATSLTVDTDTGWLSGDQIVIGKTSRLNATETETRTLNTNAGASSLAFTSGLAAAHNGTSPTQAVVGMVSRNVKIRSATSTIMTYLNFKALATINIKRVEIYYCGANATSKRGVTIETTTASCVLQYCALHDFEIGGIQLVGSATNNITVSNNVTYLMNTNIISNISIVLVGATTGTSIVFDSNIFFASKFAGTPDAVFKLNDVGITVTNNTLIDTRNGYAISLEESAAIGTISSNIITGSDGASSVAIRGAGLTGTITSTTIIRSSTDGLNIAAGINGVTFDGLTLFGNLTQNISFGSSMSNVTFNNITSNGDTSFSTTNGIVVGANLTVVDIFINNSNFSTASGIKTAHTNDVNIGTRCYAKFYIKNTISAGTNPVANYLSNLLTNSEIRFDTLGTTTNNHLWYTNFGTARSTGAGLTDTTIRTTGSLGLRIAPEDNTTGFTWSFNIPAKVGSLVNFFGFFQKNIAFGTSVARVELWLPGSTVADATATLTNVTGSWQAVSISASYTGTVNDLATIKVIGITSTSAAYLYVDDLYNAGNGTTNYDTVTGLDTWNLGKLIPIIQSQSVSAADIWTFDTTNLTTNNTTGKKLIDNLTTAKFIGLK